MGANAAQTAHPWVVERRERVSFGVQAFAPLHDPEPGARVLRAGQLCEALGLDAFFVGDHPARTPDPWLHLAALAMTTERIWLGSVVNCALYRGPLMTARLASDLDHLSSGRTMLGLGVGWDASEFAALGLPFPKASVRQDMLDEALTIIEGSWSAEPFTFEGAHYSARAARIQPPLQRPRPPIMIAGGGERRTLRQVAQRADACNIGPGAQIGDARTLDDVRRKFAALRQHCAEVGRDYDAILRSWFTQWLILAPTEAEAEAKLRRRFPDGLNSDRRASFVIGTPAQAAEFYRPLVAAGVQYFTIQTLDAADDETLRLLATELAPMVAG
jgi:alkanesulfonate monooxygenase SsuD/methylene tetrahydromethanopterin reductase-like flavin-dependent oxidoreductase (luciferase family)